MNAFVVRTELLTSHPRSWHDGIGHGIEVGDAYRGAHSDGYDYADYQEDVVEWAKFVLDVARTPQDGFLFICASRDYVDHRDRCMERGEEPLPRGEWCQAHVAGQIDRALEISDETSAVCCYV